MVRKCIFKITKVEQRPKVPCCPWCLYIWAHITLAWSLASCPAPAPLGIRLPETLVVSSSLSAHSTQKQISTRGTKTLGLYSFRATPQSQLIYFLEISKKRNDQGPSKATHRQQSTARGIFPTKTEETDNP